MHTMSARAFMTIKSISEFSQVDRQVTSEARCRTMIFKSEKQRKEHSDMSDGGRFHSLYTQSEQFAGSYVLGNEFISLPDGAKIA